MRISRDEAREIAVTALLLAIALRVGAGIVRGIEELSRDGTWRSVLERLFSLIGSSIGLMTLGVSLLVALSPTGSVSPRLFSITRVTAGVVTVLGMASALDSLTEGFSGWEARLWFSMMNGMTAAVLAGAAWWILTHLDPDR